MSVERIGPGISMTQSERERRRVWESVHASTLNIEKVKSSIKQKKFYVMPEGTVTMLRIGFMVSTIEIKYFDIGETTLTKDTEVALVTNHGHSKLEAGKSVIFTLDSHDRRELYESGEGRSALDEEKRLAKAFMNARKKLLDTPSVKLGLGHVANVQLVTKIV